jgi:hypothetical protein
LEECRKKISVSKANFNPEIKKITDSMLLEIPSVVPGKMFGYPAYYVHHKMFACLYEDGIGIKVPESAAVKLIGTTGIIPFQPLGRRTMKEWIQINREHPEDYRKDLDIFKTSIDYVVSLKK